MATILRKSLSSCNEGAARSTLQHCCLERLEIGKVHRVWNSVMPSVQDAKELTSV